MRRLLFMLILPLSLPLSRAWADTIVMADGTQRKGTVLGRTDDQILLRLDRDGIKATVALQARSIAKVIPGEMPADEPATPPVAENAPLVRTTIAAESPPARGFLFELGASAMGHGPDDPRRLPDDLKMLWNEALRRDDGGRAQATLDALRSLNDAFAQLPGGITRLDAITRREKNKPFGVWLAQTHWQVLQDKYLGGRFDLRDVRDVERQPLIGILKEKTPPALEPLRNYFPPLDPKTFKPVPFKPAQLQGISPNNAIELKQQAAYASAILLAQLQLEPQMPVMDRMLIAGQLQTVRRVLLRAADFEPAARAAAEKASRH